MEEWGAETEGVEREEKDRSRKFFSLIPDKVRLSLLLFRRNFNLGVVLPSAFRTDA
jgi:hypothetical protein